MELVACTPRSPGWRCREALKRINSGQGQIQIKGNTQETDIMTGAQPNLLCLHRQARLIQGEAGKQIRRLHSN
jgi:hypothetical protein